MLLQKELQTFKNEQEENKKITLEDFLNISSYSYLFFEGGDFSFVHFKNFKEVYNTSQHKYIIRKKGGGKKQSEKDREKTIKSIGS